MLASPAQDSLSSQWFFYQESPLVAVFLKSPPLPHGRLERKLPLKSLSELRVGTLRAAHNCDATASLKVECTSEIEA